MGDRSKLVVGLYNPVDEKYFAEFAADGFHVDTDRYLMAGLNGDVFLVIPAEQWWHVQLVPLPGDADVPAPAAAEGEEGSDGA